MGEGDGADSAQKKPQSDATPVVATTSSSGEVPAKKLARQLDFTGFGSTSGSVGFPVPPRPQVPGVTVPQSQPRPQVMGLPVPAPPQPQPPVPSVRPVKPDSPKSRPRPNIDGKDGTPKKQKQCNCKHSRCLKLYCECFASGIYCDGCNCVNCCNNVENEGARRDAVEATLERNPNAFRPKIASSPHGPRDSWEEAGELVILAKHNKGCHCKKSGCLKKYCECFQANILCSENCKCIDCKNFEGSEERQALFHGDHTNNIAYIQHAANAAITGAVGSSGYLSSPLVSKKRKGQELFFGQTAKDPSTHRIGQYPQANHFRPPTPSSSSVPVAHHSTAGLGPSKFTYRSLLADIIQPQDLKELCSVLVVVAEEAAKTLADQRNAAEKQTEASLVTTAEDRLQSQKDSDTQKAVTDDTANQADKNSPEDSNSDGVDGPKERPMSPGTLALMCDEQDTIFMSAASPNGLMGEGCNSSSQMPNGHGMTEVYAEQERIVLAKFRGCLNMLITRGELKEAEFSSFARSEAEAQREQISNGTTNPRMETGSRQGPISNGVAKAAVPPTARTSQMVPAAVPPPTARTSQMVPAAVPPPAARTSQMVPAAVPPPTSRTPHMVPAAVPPPTARTSHMVSATVPPPTARTSQTVPASVPPTATARTSQTVPAAVPPTATARTSQTVPAAVPPTAAARTSQMVPAAVTPPTVRTSQMVTAVPPPTARTSQMVTAAVPPTAAARTSQMVPAAVPPPTARTSQMVTAAAPPPTARTSQMVPAADPPTARTSQMVTASVPPTARTSQMVTATVSTPSTVPPRPPSVPGNGGNKPKA